MKPLSVLLGAIAAFAVAAPAALSADGPAPGPAPSPSPTPAACVSVSLRVAGAVTSVGSGTFALHVLRAGGRSSSLIGSDAAFTTTAKTTYTLADAAAAAADLRVDARAVITFKGCRGSGSGQPPFEVVAVAIAACQVRDFSSRGLVTAVTAGGFTIQRGNGQTGQVGVTSSTTFTSPGGGAAAAPAVGDRVLVTGTSDCSRAVTAASVVVAGDPTQPRPADATGTGPRAGQQPGGPFFRLTCAFSHVAMDDPIVFPGQTGKSHDHSFIGNRSTSASSTNASLLASDGTTCDTRDDRSAYWLPTLSVNGAAVAPLVAHVYYRKATAAPITAFPAGFRMIAGDSHATAAQPLSVVSWSCGHEAGIAPSTTPPTCPDAGRNGLRLRVAFPSCWDGTSFDSADHKSHMAYPVNGVCPADHPVATPKVVVIYHYPTTGGSGVTLASGGQLTGHADFMNAWLPGTLEARVAGLNQAPPAPAAAS